MEVQSKRTQAENSFWTKSSPHDGQVMVSAKVSRVVLVVRSHLAAPVDKAQVSAD